MKDIIPIFNASERLPNDAGTSNQPGVICLANESRFASRHYSQPLTSYITGWRDPNDIQATLDFAAPPVQVARRFEYKQSVNAEEFLSETDDLRGIGAAFKRVEFTGTTVNDKTYNKGLTLRIDHDETDEVPGWREQAVRRLTQRILRNELRRALTALTAVGTNTAKTWDTTALKDPDLDVLQDLNSGADSSGIRANRLLYSEDAWAKRMVAHRAQTTAGGFASSALTPESLAGLLGVSAIKISHERYQSGAATKTKIASGLVLEFFAMNDIGVDDPSHAKRFWTPTESGGMFRVYEQQVDSKFTDITVEHYSNVSVVTSTGLRRLTIS